MDPTIKLDERVDVITSFRRSGSINTFVVPCKMRYKNQEISFARLGMRHETSKGQRMIHIFDVSDHAGNDYRLEFDAERLSWRLTAIIQGSG